MIVITLCLSKQDLIKEKKKEELSQLLNNNIGFIFCDNINVPKASKLSALMQLRTPRTYCAF